ncbi:MAG: ABC transporter permease subunit [Holosporales bacterium]|jgi:putrescine transport system permease protein|nr:ABC transporter permease subunit [Holosporales bacterium]
MSHIAKTSKMAIISLLLGNIFLYLPIMFIVINSFSASEIPGIWTSFSLKWFFAVFEDEDLLLAAFTSLKVAVISATGAVLLGVLTAMSTAKTQPFPTKRFLSNIILMPVFMPEIIVGFSLLMFFVFLEAVLGFPKERGIATVIIGHITATIAYVYIAVRAKLSTLDISLEEAAMNLGARPFIIFLKIKIPAIGKSILVGWLLAFTMSLDDLVIASFLTGPSSTTLPILIFSNVKIGATPAINAFATMFVLTIATCLFLAYLFSLPSKNQRVLK